MIVHLQKARRLILLAGFFIVLVGRLCAQMVFLDGFETGAFNTAWGLTTGVIITNTAGANGTTRFSKLAAYTASTGRELGARFDSVVSGGAKDFSVECFFRAQSTTQRQFNLMVSTSASAISSSGASINLKYDVTNGWAAFGTVWNSIAGLGGVTPGQWYRVRVSGQDWGTTTTRWSVDVSAAGGTNYVGSATNLTWYQSGTPTANTAKYFVFTSVFGNNPGFDVDEVSAAVTTTNVTTVSNAIVNISGVYPHLAVFSPDGEIGIGAVMPWAGKLWFVTYPPHGPNGSSDKLWMLDTNLTLAAHPSSVGCTDANRLIHRESQQLNIGHYLIDSNANVRVIAPATMPGRLTGSARHLYDATNKIYIATMEEGLYEVNVNTLAVTELYHDMNTSVGPGQTASALPGQHGKGLYSSQGKLFYSNNGVGGSLSQWNGTNWTVIETNKFTELTGPGGVYGNDVNDDRLWSLGWDTRSVILRLLQNGVWARFRLPKASYTHDADHGWFTEWPRIREVVDGKMLMHMHGMFYYFPKTFSATNTGGITPISTMLKMPVDYCWWNGQLMMGRDDAATTGQSAPVWTGQSDSAPWFGQLSDLEKWGTPAGFGGVWLNDSITANVPSEAFLVKNFQRRILHLKHTTAATVNFTLQQDVTGNGTWTNLTTISITNNGYAYFIFPPNLDTTWVRLVADQNATGVTAYFHLQNPPQPPAPDLFAGLADANATNALSDGIIRSQQGDARTLQFASTIVASNGSPSTAYYEINGALQLTRATNATTENTLRTTYGLSNAGFTLDAASVIFTDGANRFRLPRSSSAAFDAAFASGWPRGAREVTTERQLFQAHGTFYELPYSASGGFRRIRPVTTHNKHISDFASWRGLLALAGVMANAATNTHVYRSDDDQAALWLGEVDDLWRMGAPRGVGGPWKNSAVTNGVASDPYLMFGYERKELSLSHSNAVPVTFTVEVDFASDNSWSEYARFTVAPGQTLVHVFPDGYSAHWVRVKSDTSTTATAQFTYGPPAPRIVSATQIDGGNFQLTFSGSPGQAYTVHANTDLSLPVANWPALTNGIFKTNAATFIDAATTNQFKRFYLISVP